MANAIRALSMDAVEAAKSGHPGMPLGAADVDGRIVGPVEGEAEVDGGLLAAIVGFADVDGRSEGASLGWALIVG